MLHQIINDQKHFQEQYFLPSENTGTERTTIEKRKPLTKEKTKKETKLIRNPDNIGRHDEIIPEFLFKGTHIFIMWI